MQRTQQILKSIFVATLVVAALIVLLFETNIVEAGALAGNENLEFVVLSVVELVVICSIPLALRLFKFKGVRRQLIDQPAQKLLAWGTSRLLMLSVPLVACVLLYYLFFMEAAFGYLAIILALSMMFVRPSKDRCEAETTDVTSPQPPADTSDTKEA